MRIGIEGWVLRQQKTGIGHYTSNLIKYLSKIDKDNKYIIFPEEGKLDGTKSIITVPALVFEKIRYLLWLNTVLPLVMIKKVDILHCTNFLCPIVRVPNCKYVITVHDLSSVLHGLESLWFRVYKASLLFLPLKIAHKIIVPSEATKKDILKTFCIDPKKITVIHEGVDTEVYKPIRQRCLLKEVTKKYGISGRFILHVGVLDERKNLEVLIKAYHRLKTTKNLSHKLVLVGKKSPLYDGITKLVKELALEGDVIFTGYVSQEDLPLLYNAADVFVCPSLYEGFGLPVLEAMACGIPVICSNTTSLPEVVGDAAIMKHPLDIDGFMQSLYAVLTNQSLHQQMSENGLKRAKLFTWEKTARETLAVYEEIYNE